MSTVGVCAVISPRSSTLCFTHTHYHLVNFGHTISWIRPIFLQVKSPKIISQHLFRIALPPLSNKHNWNFVDVANSTLTQQMHILLFILPENNLKVIFEVLYYGKNSISVKQEVVAVMWLKWNEVINSQTMRHIISTSDLVLRWKVLIANYVIVSTEYGTNRIKNK